MMNTRALNTSLNLLQILLKVNFNASVIVLIISSLLSLTGNTLLIDDNNDLYGPVANNLRLVMFYLCLMQISVYGFYQMSCNFAALIGLGVFMLCLMGALEFYSVVNQIEIDQSYQPLFVYSGLSHLLYGGLGVLRKQPIH
jgi:hypothetical protein